MDIADGHISALRYIERLPPTERYNGIYNLGTGRGMTVLELIHVTERLTGCPIPYAIAPRRIGDIPVAYCSPDRARDVLGWQTHRTMDDAIRDEWRYVQNHL